VFKLLNLIIPQTQTTRQNDRIEALRQAFIRREAKIGGRIFGELPRGRKRDFFCLDEHTWVWHEEWVDANGQTHIVSTRYDVSPNGVLKSQNGASYQKASRDEVRRLYQAAKLYQERIKKEVYNFAS